MEHKTSIKVTSVEQLISSCTTPSITMSTKQINQNRLTSAKKLNQNQREN